MGKYDGPHFEVEEENTVSIWVASCSLSEIPEDYFEEDVDGDDDDPFNPFSTDFGFGYYDHDSAEANGSDEPLPIGELTHQCSYGDSFSEQVKAHYPALKSEHIFMIYDFRYDPEVTGTDESRYYRFIGHYRYEDN